MVLESTPSTALPLVIGSDSMSGSIQGLCVICLPSCEPWQYMLLRSVEELLVSSSDGEPAAGKWVVKLFTGLIGPSAFDGRPWGWERGEKVYCHCQQEVFLFLEEAVKSNTKAVLLNHIPALQPVMSPLWASSSHLQTSPYNTYWVGLSCGIVTFNIKCPSTSWAPSKRGYYHRPHQSRNWDKGAEKGRGKRLIHTISVQVLVLRVTSWGNLRQVL